MGTTGKAIVGEGALEIVDLLNKALADEWLAHYQYWVGALVAKGPMRPDVQKELNEHAEDEKRHAGMLAERIIQLGGTPITNPAEWMKKTNCGYDEPKDPHVLKLLAQNIKGEQCAIGLYNKILKKIMLEKDPITYNIIRKIMEDEVEHEQDLQDLEEDIMAH
ncbi:MAG: ferritin-like domain-containing protein [Candidatus Micrarchaeota archaeon]